MSFFKPKIKKGHVRFLTIESYFTLLVVVKMLLFRLDI